MTIQDHHVFSRYRLTVDDYERLDAAGAFAAYPKTELIDGVVYTMSPQYRPHWRAKNELVYRLRRALEALGSDLYVGAEGSVRFSDHDQPEPDIIVTAAPDGDGAIPGGSVPLLVEVAATTLAIDLGEKALFYAAAGVAEYWVIDVDGRTIHQLSKPEPDGYREKEAVPFGGIITSAAIDRLVIETAGL